MQVAGVLSGLSREAYLYAAAKWIQDKSVEPELFYRIYLIVGGLAIKHKWRVPKGRELLRGLTQLAIIEMVREPRCRHCNGNTCKAVRIYWVFANERIGKGSGCWD